MRDSVLSVFIDESGDFGSYESHAPFYIVSMVLHDQKIDITDNIHELEEHISNLEFSDHAIHVGPLIRRESIYQYNLTEERKKLFSALFNFARKLPFCYCSIKVKKSECNGVIAMTAKISKAISDKITEYEDFFQSFDKIILYYDNGQVELTQILTSVFNARFSNVDIRKVKPVDYKLFQVADLICTMELLAEKNEFTNSEQNFFHSKREFSKNFYKHLQKKKL